MADEPQQRTRRPLTEAQQGVLDGVHRGRARADQARDAFYRQVARAVDEDAVPVAVIARTADVKRNEVYRWLALGRKLLAEDGD